MPDNKKHHYVPKFYLKRFSENTKSIGLYNLEKKLKVARAPLKSQCYQDYFYGKDQVTEKVLCQLEGEIAALYKSIDEHASLPPILSEEHIAFVISVIIQYGRTKYSADSLDEINDKFIKHVYRDKIEAEVDDVNLDDYFVGIEDVAKYSMGLFVQQYPHTLDLNYKLIINKTKTEFVTSDNPVVFYNQLLLNNNAGSNTGLAVKGLQVFLPLSPDKLVMMYDHNVYRVGKDRVGVIEITNDQDIYNINALQMVSCYENIYFCSDSQRMDALHRKANPFLREAKTTFNVISEQTTGNSRSELVITSKQDVKLNMNLSFVSIRKKAREWRNDFLKLNPRPVTVLRNEEYHQYVDEFIEKVRDGEHKTEDFVAFIYKKFEDVPGNNGDGRIIS